MKINYWLPFVLMLLFTFCDKKESDTPVPEDVAQQLIGRWKEVETMVEEYDINNNLLHTTPNLSPVKVVFDGQKVTTEYAETFIESTTRPYSVTKVGNKNHIIFDDDDRSYEITEISATNLTLVVKQMGTEFNGVRFHYILYTRKLVKL